MNWKSFIRRCLLSSTIWSPAGTAHGGKEDIGLTFPFQRRELVSYHPQKGYISLQIVCLLKLKVCYFLSLSLLNMFLHFLLHKALLWQSGDNLIFLPVYAPCPFLLDGYRIFFLGLIALGP